MVFCLLTKEDVFFASTPAEAKKKFLLTLFFRRNRPGFYVFLNKWYEKTLRMGRLETFHLL